MQSAGGHRPQVQSRLRTAEAGGQVDGGCTDPGQKQAQKVVAVGVKVTRRSWEELRRILFETEVSERKV